MLQASEFKMAPPSEASQVGGQLSSMFWSYGFFVDSPSDISCYYHHYLCAVAFLCFEVLKLIYRLLLIFMHSSEMSTRELTRRETYCTNCKQNVPIKDAEYVKLANGRAMIKGKCPRCSVDLIKVSIMPKSSALKFFTKKRKRRAKRTLPIA